GGGVDIIARLIGQWLSERFGQQFIMENRPGAGTNIATEAVVRAPPDGYTLLLVNAANAVNATLYDNLSFNFVRDIAPVADLMAASSVMLVHPSVPAKTVPEFIAYAKANPGKINMASGGVGSPANVAGELFKMMAGVNMIHVPYRGLAPAMTDLLGGQVQVIFGAVTSSIEYIKAGRLRALAALPQSARRRCPNCQPGASSGRATRRVSGTVLAWPKRAHRDHRQTQQGDQRGPCRPQYQNAPCRPRWRCACWLARRVRQAHRRRNRQVGRGNPGGKHQGGISIAIQRGDAMKLPRRTFLHLAVGAAAVPAMPRFAWAQSYPTRPVRLILGYAPGNAPDIVARLIGQWLSERLGQPFIIENRPGGGGNIGTEAVVRASPDGYTLLYVTTANASNATLFENLKFNFMRDIAP